VVHKARPEYLGQHVHATAGMMQPRPLAGYSAGSSVTAATASSWRMYPKMASVCLP
jgi:hypothetical protein